MSTGESSILDALKQALERDPKNGPLWLHYADLLVQAGREEEAIVALRTALELKTGDPRAAAGRLVSLLRRGGQLAEALIRAEKLLEDGDDLDVRLELARVLKARGDRAAALEQYLQVLGRDPGRVDSDLEGLRGSPEADAGEGEAREEKENEDRSQPRLAPVAPESLSPEELASQFDWSDLRITFADVAGLDDVKKQIHLRIIAPFKNKEIYSAFRRQAGGGILLYGPPGCGKTFIARATAGECGARFVSVGIHDILDKYWGESEKLLHSLFDEARRRAPTVLFFDEFDALGAGRGRAESQFWKTLVDQLLQEMDGVGGRNEDVLVFAATNMPWNVDSAFRRPGRFDRLLFVPLPDQKARAQILRRHSEKLPGGEKIPVEKIARLAQLFTGADLKSLCERASEEALSRSLESGKVHPVSLADFEKELKKMNGSASEWLSTARNYSRYSNESGQYDELVDFLKKIKRW